ncbi:MAG: ParB/RepB/Spo0J family partition protein [Alistipes sp.]|nr:ParB/RepB/Spo0J family partition protein [Alistipes sp.]
MNPKAKGLGRGLGAIFEIEGTALPEKSKNTTFEEIEIARIVPNPRQPRTLFPEEALSELADSIRALGVIQPITVKREAENFKIVSGERRWRASQMAGLESIPAYIREVDDQALLEMALVENIQRQDLNAMEVALSLQRLVDECSLTQDVLADRVGKKRSTVANYMRLLRLPGEVQLALREDLISMGHPRALAGLTSETQQLALLKRILKRSLSVRQVEELVQRQHVAQESMPEEKEFPESYSRLVDHLERFFTQEISIKKNNKGGGKIVIGFDSDEQIEQFVRKFSTFER